MVCSIINQLFLGTSICGNIQTLAEFPKIYGRIAKFTWKLNLAEIWVKRVQPSQKGIIYGNLHLGLPFTTTPTPCAPTRFIVSLGLSARRQREALAALLRMQLREVSSCGDGENLGQRCEKMMGTYAKVGKNSGNN